MAMRNFSRTDFYAELERMGLKSTETKTTTHQIWKARDGQTIPVPHVADVVPDYVLDALLQKVGQLYQCANPAVSRTYTITEQEVPPNIKVVK